MVEAIKSRSSLDSFFDNLITMEELLALLRNNWSRKSIYAWIEKEGMPAIKLMGKWCFPKTEVLLWLERRADYGNHKR